MTETRSSSNRQGGVCDAVLVQDQSPVGPIRLPEHRADDFVDHFNRIYEGLGIQLLPLEEDSQEAMTQQKKSPET